MWAIILWIEGLQPRQAWYLVGSGVLMAASALTKYFGAVLILLPAAYSLARPRRLETGCGFCSFQSVRSQVTCWCDPRLQSRLRIHHTGQTLSLLKEAARVGRAVVI